MVYLVGAGPGDPGLMTGRSLELVARADAILYDRLIPPGALEGARPEAELRYVGKEPGAAASSQEDTNGLLVELGRAGKRVVRLKGGDPFVFGRGGEEAEALAAAGVPFEVVPGVTAGVAAPAYAGIPVTHRDAASAVAFVTGHEDPAKPDTALDWDALARFPGQRTVVDTLSGIAARVEAEDVRPPSITVVGRVAELRETIAWLEARPLHGEVVAVTRARAQASGLAATLRELGAEVVETPAIRIEPRPVEGELRAAIDRIEEYALVCVTSPNGVQLLFDALATVGRDARALAGATVAAIGPGTAAALAERGIVPDVVPERFVAEALVEALAPVEVQERRGVGGPGGGGGRGGRGGGWG